MPIQRSSFALSSLAVAPALALALALAAAALGPRLAQASELTLLQVAEDLEAGSSELQRFTAFVPPEPSLLGSLAAGPAMSETLGEQRVLVSLVNFSHDPSTPALAADIETAILDAANPGSSASFVLEASYGRAWLSGSVEDWVSVSYGDPSCDLAQPEGTQQLIDELDSSVDFSAIDRWIIVIPHNSTCFFAGYSTLGKWSFESDEGTVSFSRAIVNGPRSSLSALVSHELGHGFAGLQHAVDHECGLETVGSDCSYEGSDRYSVLGDTNGHGHFTPPSKQALGWFDGDLVDVPPAGGTYLLEPYATPSGGTKVLRIPAPSYTGDYSEGRFYYVSYRTPVGFDSLFSELSDGAMLHLDAHFFPEFSTDAIAGSRLLDARPDTTSQGVDSIDVLLEVGEVFDDVARGVSIETLGVVGGDLQVSVTRSQYCGNGVRDEAFAEDCDGADLAGESCASIGRSGGTLGCAPSCSFDTSLCGAALCEPNDDYDDATQLCTASLLSVGPRDMNVYRNAASLADARSSPSATLLTSGRGFLAVIQNFSGTDRSIVHRLQLPFDTSVLPDGATIESATLRLKLDEYPDIGNTHPSLSDQLVLVQTNDSDPFVRSLSDFGSFVPVDAPPEGAARVDVGDDLVDYQSFSMSLNETGLSWIDDAGYTRLGLRMAFDVDDDVVVGALQDLRVGIVPTSSPIAGPRLELEYQPVPEPGSLPGLLAGGALLQALARRSRTSARPRATSQSVRLLGSGT